MIKGSYQAPAELKLLCHHKLQRRALLATSISLAAETGVCELLAIQSAPANRYAFCQIPVGLAIYAHLIVIDLKALKFSRCEQPTKNVV
jgi:hypothetical protein